MDSKGVSHQQVLAMHPDGVTPQDAVAVRPEETESEPTAVETAKNEPASVETATIEPAAAPSSPSQLSPQDEQEKKSKIVRLPMPWLKRTAAVDHSFPALHTASVEDSLPSRRTDSQRNKRLGEEPRSYRPPYVGPRPNESEMKNDFIAFGFSPDEVKELMKRKGDLYTASTPGYIADALREAAQVTEKRVNTRRENKLAAAREPLFLQNNKSWALFDPWMGMPKDMGKHPDFFEDLMEFKPDNKRILEYNINTHSVRVRSTPEWLLGKRVEYTVTGPKIKTPESDSELPEVEDVEKTEESGSIAPDATVESSMPQGETVAVPPKRGRGRPRKHPRPPPKTAPVNDGPFKIAKGKEKLIEDGASAIATNSKAPVNEDPSTATTNNTRDASGTANDSDMMNATSEQNKNAPSEQEKNELAINDYDSMVVTGTRISEPQQSGTVADTAKDIAGQIAELLNQDVTTEGEIETDNINKTIAALNDDPGPSLNQAKTPGKKAPIDEKLDSLKPVDESNGKATNQVVIDENPDSVTFLDNSDEHATHDQEEIKDDKEEIKEMMDVDL